MDGSPYEGPPVHPPFRTDSGHLSPKCDPNA